MVVCLIEGAFNPHLRIKSGAGLSPLPLGGREDAWRRFGRDYWDWVLVVGGVSSMRGMNPLRLATLDASPFCDAKGEG